MASAARACAASGSDIAGFSPMMTIPRIVPAWIASVISTTVRPGVAGSGAFQYRSNQARLSAAVARR